MCWCEYELRTFVLILNETFWVGPYIHALNHWFQVYWVHVRTLMHEVLRLFPVTHWLLMLGVDYLITYEPVHRYSRTIYGSASYTVLNVCLCIQKAVTSYCQSCCLHITYYHRDKWFCLVALTFHASYIECDISQSSISCNTILLSYYSIILFHADVCD